MHRLFANRGLRGRFIALAAAYAIALSSLLASFNTARAATDAAALPGGVICHNIAAGQPVPSSDGSNNKTCANGCCVGCLMLMAALPQPPANASAVVPQAKAILYSLAIAAVPGTPETRSHRSRAPPYDA